MRSKTVYVGSLWHEDCDPFISVVAFNPKHTQAHLDNLARAEYLEMKDEFECPDCEDYCDCEPENTIRTGGVFPETLGDFYDGLVDSEKRWKLKELLQDSVCYL